MDILTEKDEEMAVSVILDIGEVMLTSGAEVNRVEDTIRRIGKAYGFPKVDIFTIINLMVMTVHTKKDRVITQSRRVTSVGVDLEKVAKANALSRSVCASPVSLQELQLRVHDVIYNTKHYGMGVKLLSYVLGAASFTVFFGGGAYDAFASAVASLAVCLMVTAGNKLRIHPIISTLMSSFVMSMLIAGLISIGVGQSFDKIVIGNIMLLIPGLALTTSIRDIITGDTVSGLMGICEALLKAFAIAIGCAATMLLTGII
ncbi:MAG: threonine/serine exporter family protein [Lachnospiraceae bacterium]|nr:threonine/serine exporter family protein [Lachnospiraceae bacterium]